MTAKRYTLFGLEFDSEVDLVAPPGSDETSPDVVVRKGAVRAPSNGSLDVDGAQVRIEIADVARFSVTGGTEIIVDPFTGTPPENVRLFLMGSVAGVLLHQRGLLPLHGNAIAIDGAAALFLGESGAGKSTLAAWAYDEGYPVIADDVSVVGRSPDGIADVRPGVPRFRLGEDALRRSGRDPANLPRSFLGDDRFDKRDLRASDDRMVRKPLPLRAIYVLERGASPAIVPVDGAARVELLFAHTYRGAFVHALGGSAAHFEQCARLAREVPLFRFIRRWDPDHLVHDARIALAHAAAQSSPRSTASRK